MQENHNALLYYYYTSSNASLTAAALNVSFGSIPPPGIVQQPGLPLDETSNTWRRKRIK